MSIVMIRIGFGLPPEDVSSSVLWSAVFAGPLLMILAGRRAAETLRHEDE